MAYRFHIVPRISDKAPDEFTKGVDAIAKSYQRMELQLGATRARQVWTRAFRSIMRLLVSSARARVPAQTGRLRMSVSLWPARKGIGMNFGYRFRASGEADPPLRRLGIRIGQSLGSEFGNRRFPHPARALKTAWEQHRKTLEDGVRHVFVREMEREHTKLQARLTSLR